MDQLEYFDIFTVSSLRACLYDLAYQGHSLEQGRSQGGVAKNKLFWEKFFERPCLSLRPPKNEGLATPLLLSEAKLH